MALPPRVEDSSDWSAEITRVLEPYQKVLVAFYRPGARAANGTGPEPQTLLLATKARVVVIRAPLEAISVTQWSTERSVRLQVPMLAAGTLLLPKGTVARIISGSKDPVLYTIPLRVTSAINSGDAAVRTVETVSEITPTSPVTGAELAAVLALLAITPGQ